MVSLTSHGKRLGRAHLAVETLLRQTVAAEKIVLWVADALTLADIPVPLRRQRRRGLEIRFVPDVGPHTKGVYAFRDFPDRAVITVDDDTLYPPDLIERLVAAATTEPQHVHCHRAHEIRLAADGLPAPYSSWRLKVDDVSEASFRVFPCGVGGVIYPPGTLHQEVFNRDVFRAICTTADDVWFKAMALLQGTKAKRLPGPRHEFPVVSGTYRLGLWANINFARNDPQIAAVFERYDLAGRLRSDEQPPAAITTGN